MSELVIEILENFLGEPKNHYEEKHQISFDCPVCSYEIKGLDRGDGKGNLEINYDYGVYKCWSCSETHDTHGTLYSLIKKFGTKKDIERYKLITPDIIHNQPEKEKKVINGLPPEFLSLSYETKDFDYRLAMDYLLERNIGLDIINKYNIGYINEGEYKGRIIFPSYDNHGNINYFLGRSYYKNSKKKYKNPEISKTEIIFNEGKIKWDSNIYLVEGVFDHIVVPNSIPLLGKVLYDKLYDEITKKCDCKVIILLDSDAKMDGFEIYKKLNSTKLRNRVLMINLPTGYDISDIHRLLGREGVSNVLGTAKSIKESILW
jgi:hypothetical protein